jgi:uncharacterized membrane protein
MDMGKCCVVVIAPEDQMTADKMTPEMMHALVRAREAHIRYRTYVMTAFVQLGVTAVLSSSSPTTLALGILASGLVNAAVSGLVARVWRRRFEKLACA